MNNEYVALIAFAAVVFIVFLGGLLWQKYRRFLGRRFNLRNYREDTHETSHPVTQHR